MVSASCISMGLFSVLASFHLQSLHLQRGVGELGVSCSQNCPHLADWKCQGTYTPSTNETFGSWCTHIPAFLPLGWGNSEFCALHLFPLVSPKAFRGREMAWLPILLLNASPCAWYTVRPSNTKTSEFGAQKGVLQDQARRLGWLKP